MPTTDEELTGRDPHTQLVDWVEDFEEATLEARDASRRDRDYYDGKQWTDAELQQLKKRGQPPVVINRIAPIVNRVRGQEVRTRIDPSALPRTPVHQDGSIAATDGMRYVADKEDFNGLRATVVENLAIEGYAGCVVDLAEGPDGKDEIRLRYVPWDRIFYDPHSRMADFSDAKYLGTIVWMDAEDAKHLYADMPQAADDAEAHIVSTLNTTSYFTDSETFDDRPRDWSDSKRNRVKIAEVYWREDGIWKVAHLTQSGFLVEPRPTGLLDENGKDEAPIELASTFVDRDNRRYGIVRNLISPQDEINKRRSKALHLLSVRQVLAEQDAVLNPMDAKQQLARPDGWVELAPGALRDGSFQVSDGAQLAQAQLGLLQEAKAEIDAIGPQVPQNLDRPSGRFALMQQQAATLELEPLFDNLRDWQHRVFRQIWHRIRQAWTDERWIRLRDDPARKGLRFVGLNRKIKRMDRVNELLRNGTDLVSALRVVGAPPTAEATIAQFNAQAQQLQQAGQQIDPAVFQQQLMAAIAAIPEMDDTLTDNDVGELDVDIVLDATPDTAVVEQEEFERLALLAQSGQVAIPPAVLIQASQLRNKRELMQMLEDAAPDQEAAAEAQQQQMQMQMQLVQAQVATLTAQAQERQAKAQAEQVEMQKTMAEVQGVLAEAEKDRADAVKKMTEAQTMAPKVAAEAQKDSAIAARHLAEASGEYQAQATQDEDRLGGPAPLVPPGD